MNYGIVQKNFVTAIDPMMDTREINAMVADVYNENGLIDILGWSDRKKVITSGQNYFRNNITEQLFQEVVPTSVSNNNSTSITLVLNAATSGHEKVQDILTFTDNVTGIVYSKTTASGIDTIVVKTLNGGNLNATAGDHIGVTSVAVGEGASALPSPRFGNTWYTNKTQKFSESTSITDVQKMAKLEINYNGSPYWTTRQDLECKILLRGKINAQFINGDMSTTSFTDPNPTLTDQNSGGRAVQTTRGVDKYIMLYGLPLNAGGGAYTLSDVGDMQDVLIAARAPKKYMIISGSAAKRRTDDMWKATGSSGINSVRIQLGAKERSIDLQVDQASYGGFEMNYVNMPILDHPIIFNSSNVVSKSQYWIPFDAMVKTAYEGMQPSIQARYVPHGGPYGDGIIGASYDGALSPFPTGTTQTSTVSYNTEQGCECLGVQHFGRQQVL